MSDNVTPLRDDLIGSAPSGSEFSGALRQPPVNYEAEQALLGAILANNQAFERVSDYLRAEHFADAVNGRIFAACQKLIDRGHVADAVQLRHVFAQDEALTEISGPGGGGDYLMELQNNVISIINANDYGRTIYDLYLRRELIGVGETIVNSAHDIDLDHLADAQIEEAEGKLFNLAEAGSTESGPKSFSQTLIGALEVIESAHRQRGSVVGVDTGLKALNDKLGGLHRSDLIILAGRPAMGKTALAMNIGFNAATKGSPVLFFSLEMSAEQLATRILASETGASSDQMRKGALSEEQMTKLIKVSRQLDELPLFIDDTPAITVGALRARARRLKRQRGLEMIIIDYVQLMRGSSSNSDNRVQEISEITRGLKAIAKELDLPVLALSQLSRAVENRDDKKPQLSDLRESGSIEQDADVVSFVYRPEYYLEKQRPIEGMDDEAKFQQKLIEWQARMEQVYNKALVIIGKQRHGPVGEVPLFFDGPTTTFKDLVNEDALPEEF